MFKSKRKIKEPENYQKAYEYAVFLLSLQLRTVGEVRDKMLTRGYMADVIEKVVCQLLEQKYLDDERYAEVFLDNLKQYKNLGYFGIKKKFMAKKLPNDLVERVLTEGLSVDEELKIAKRFLQKEGVVVKVSVADADAEENTYSTFSREQSQAKQKTTQRLKARGFRGDVIAKIIF